MSIKTNIEITQEALKEVGGLRGLCARVQELERIGQRIYLQQPAPTARQTRIQQLQAAYPTDPPPWAVELIEALSTADLMTEQCVTATRQRDQAQRDYDSLLADVQYRLKEMMARLAAVAPGSTGAAGC
jgi:hypothetical protein